MPYQHLKTHKQRGECQRDGINHYEQNEDDEMAVVGFNERPNQNELIKYLYVFERDSKYIHIFDL
jgi:hypothetical protein